MKKSKILIFAHDASLYGASQSLLTLIEGIIENRLTDILVLLPHKGPIEDIFAAKKINYKVIDYPRCFVWNNKSNSGIIQQVKNRFSYQRQVNSILPQLVNIVNQYKPDIIYSNSSIISIGCVLAKKMNLPHVWHIREFGDLDYDFKYLPSRKYVVKQMRLSDKVIFVSKILKTHWLQNDTGNSCVVYNGLVKDGQSFPVKTFPISRFRFGILGALLPGKGQDIAIKAISLLAKKFPTVTLYIYGNVANKDYYKKLEKIISESGCASNVNFIGFEKNQDIIYDNLDVLLNCSIMEGFGRTIIEAMSRGIPVIANASGGPLEIIKHNENGLLYDRTPENLSLCMQDLITNEILYKNISENGKLNAFKNYSVASYVNNVSNILENVYHN